jgi:hypothetical protein
MATDSFANVSHTNWLPATAYQSIQTSIQQEVGQGVWANREHTDGWCFIGASTPYGINNSWVTYTYQLISDSTQTATVIWPAAWPAPAENINGQLPTHFFNVTFNTAASSNIMGLDSGESGAITTQPLYQLYVAPVNKVTYKAAGIC